MKVTNSFVKVYNATFKFIHERYGKKAVVDYWKTIAPIALADLEQIIKRDGLFGCVRYWDDVMSAEGADYQIKYKQDLFTMDITKCPSLTVLDSPYEHYCRHCEVMYKPLFRGLGYTYQIKRGKEGCRITVFK